MFGFQRIGDLIWAAADARAKGFLLGGTAGRTTLNGEGLQHQDGHSLRQRHRLSHRAGLRPGLRLRDRRDHPRRHAAAVRRRRRRRSTTSRSRTRTTRCPRCPRACEEGIIRGIYKLSTKDAGQKRPHVQLFGSGAILREALRAAGHPGREVQHVEQRLERHQLHGAAPRRAGCRRWNMLHPDEPPRKSYFEQAIAGRIVRAGRRR